MHICVVGLGNIGFNLLTYLVERFPGEVTGVDINEQRIEEIQELGFKVTSDYQTLNAIDTDSCIVIKTGRALNLTPFFCFGFLLVWLNRFSG